MSALGGLHAIYARRSTEEHQAASLDVQLGEARRYIAARGWTLDPAHVFIDDAISRAEFKRRAGLMALLNATASRAFDVVVARDESRIGGDTYRTGIVIQDMLDHGVRLFFYFTDEEVRLDGAIEKFLVAARAFAAELEREKTSQRTHEHLMNARRGLNVGGRVYGYENVEIKEGGGRSRHRAAGAALPPIVAAVGAAPQLRPDGVCIGLTPVGRATMAALQMNATIPRFARACQIMLGLLSAG